MKINRWLLVAIVTIVSGIALYSNVLTNKSLKVKNAKAADSTVILKAVQWLGELKSYYKAHPNYSVKIDHYLYESFSSTSISEHYKGFYSKEGEKEFSQILGVTTIQNQQHRLVVDTNAKTILLINPLKVVAEEELLNLNSKELIATCESVNCIDSSGVRTLTFNFKSFQYPLKKLTLIIVHHRLTLIEMLHNEAVESESGKKIVPKTKIVYSDYKEKFRIPKGKLQIDQFINKKKNIYEPVNRYANYLVYDLTSKN